MKKYLLVLWSIILGASVTIAMESEESKENPQQTFQEYYDSCKKNEGRNRL